MAKAEINLAVETVVHKAFAALAQSIADQHGIRVNNVYFSWLDAGTTSENKYLLTEVSLDTSSKAPASRATES